MFGKSAGFSENALLLYGIVSLLYMVEPVTKHDSTINVHLFVKLFINLICINSFFKEINYLIGCCKTRVYVGF